MAKLRLGRAGVHPAYMGLAGAGDKGWGVWD
jgi:hypothetical protein